MYALREDDHVILHCDNYESNALLIAMAPDLAARVLELEAENKRLREGVLIIKRSWDWWNEDRHDRCSSAVSDAIDAALKGGEI
jgi:hypothetical protein